MERSELAERVYMGVVIARCERVRGEHDGEWVVQTIHATTGMMWADEMCPHFQTVREAKAYVRDFIEILGTPEREEV